MKRFLPFIITTIILAAGYTALCAVSDTEHMLPRTAVNGTDVSRMSLDTAVETLKKEHDHAPGTLIISLDGTDYSVSIANALTVDYKSAAEEALQKSRVSFFRRGYMLISAFLSGNHIDAPPVRADTALLYDAITASGFPDIDTYTRKPYHIQNDRLIFHAGASTEKIDREGLIRDILDAFSEETCEKPIPCPMIPVSDADLEEIYNEIYIEAQNATLDAEHNYAIVESQSGIAFDMEEAQTALNTAKKGTEASVPLLYTEPEVTTSDLKEHMFADTLSTYTTTVSGTPNCVTNIKLAAEKCGIIILPAGSVFSFNDTVGEQTAAAGYKTADAIYMGEIIQAYGGGVCQVSTTIFAAALYTDLDILEHWNHDFVSSYAPAGYDAAVAWGSLDMRIQNTSAYPVMIKVDCTDDALTATIYGTKTDNAVIEIETEVLENSAPNTMDVITRRKIYMEDNGNMFVKQVAFSSYTQ